MLDVLRPMGVAMLDVLRPVGEPILPRQNHLHPRAAQHAAHPSPPSKRSPDNLIDDRQRNVTSPQPLRRGRLTLQVGGLRGPGG